jgi:predicted nucleic acid-binding protein
MTLVIDASVAMKWLIDCDETLRAQALIDSDRLVAPDLIMAETANALWRYTIAGLLDETAGKAALAALGRIIDQTYPLAPLAGEAHALACRLGHPAYDCFYLALAAQVEGHVVTADRRLAAKVAGTPWKDRVRLL